MSLIQFLIVCPLAFLAGLVDSIAGAAFCTAGHYIGSGMVIKNGNKVVKPIIITVLALLFIKIIMGN